MGAQQFLAQMPTEAFQSDGVDPRKRWYGSYQWTCKLPDSISDNTMLSSPTFMAGSYRWSLSCYLYETKDLHNDNLGLYLCSEEPVIESLDVVYQLWVANAVKPADSVFGESSPNWVFAEDSKSWYFNHLISMTRLLGVDNGFRHNDSFDVGVHMYVKVDSIAQQKEEDPNPFINQQLMTCFTSRFNEEALSDVILTAEGTRIRVHKCVLASQSDILQAMFLSGMREQTMPEIELGEVQGSVLESLMSFMYGQLHDVPKEQLLHLFVAADTYQVSALRAICLKQLEIELDAESALQLASLAHVRGYADMLEVAMQFIKNNRQAVARQAGMQTLMQEQPDLAHQLVITLAGGESERFNLNANLDVIPPQTPRSEPEQTTPEPEPKCVGNAWTPWFNMKQSFGRMMQITCISCKPFGCAQESSV